MSIKPGQSNKLKKADRYISLSFGALIFVLMTTVLIAGVTYVWDVLHEEEYRLSKIITELLAKSASRVSFSGKYHTRLLLEEIKKEQPNISYVLIADIDGNIIAHSNSNQNDTILGSPSKALITDIINNNQAHRRYLSLNNESILEVSLAYKSGYNNSISGIIQVGISTQMLNDALLKGMLYIALLFLVLMIVGILVTHRISHYFGNPIKELANDMAATLSAIPDLLFELDQEGRYVQVLSHQEDLLIRSRERLLGKTIEEVFPTRAAEVLHEALDQADKKNESHGHQIALNIEDKEHWFELSVAKKYSDGPSSFIVLSRDITDRKVTESQLNYLAHFDPLTTLLNRFSLESRLDQALLSAQRKGEQVAVMFIDMDRFKDINDTLSHTIGDQFLIEISRRLRQSVRKSDIVARLGGDEFIIVLTDIGTDLVTVHIAETVLKILSQPYNIDGHELRSSSSIGISLFPFDGTTPEQLMKGADTAMYHAKENGRNNYQFFSAPMTTRAENRIKLESDLRIALEENQFELYYQPQIATSDDRLCGVEALIRWNHPQNGVVSPIEFIPVAEEIGLIVPMGAWVLDQACQQISAWQKQGFKQVRMSVNLSANQLKSSQLVELVRTSLDKYHLDGTSLELEITESVAMKNPQKAIKTLEELRAMGIYLAIDDFGTGYSSLAYLKRLPIQTLKIDREFIRDIETDQNDASISTATIALAHSLGLRVIAEGVETQGQRDILARKQCEVLQGYLYGKPMPAQELFQYWQNRSLVNSQS